MADGTYTPTASEALLVDDLLGFMRSAPMPEPFAHEDMWIKLVGDVRKESAP